MSSSKVSSSKALIFFLVVAMAVGITLTFTKKMKPITLTFAKKMKPIHFLQNHTLIHAKNFDVSKAWAIAMSSSLCQNTSGIMAHMKRSFSGFFYVELWIRTPPVRANMAIDRDGPYLGAIRRLHQVFPRSSAKL